MKDFDEYIEEGIVKKQSPDISRAKFLVKESEKSYSFLKKIIKDFGVTEENSNSIIKLGYDIIMELIRAKMLENGLNASGKGAHESEVAYLRKLSFTENEIQFADKIRYFRNGIMYYGKQLDKEYAEKGYSLLNKICLKLKPKNSNSSILLFSMTIFSLPL